MNILPPLQIRMTSAHRRQQQHGHTQRLSKPPHILTLILQPTKRRPIPRRRELLAQHQHR